MPSFRPERVAAMLHREVAERLRMEIKDPRVVDISITSVVMSKDLSKATVSYLPLGGGGESPELQDGLDEAARRMRGPIGRALRLRHAPEIVFAYDTHSERAFAVTRLIDQLSAERDAPREGEGRVGDGSEE